MGGECVMHWEKKGLIFRPNKETPWMVSHAANPVAYHLEGNVYRVYYAGRNNANQSSVGYFELDITKPKEILSISKEPVLWPGDIGYFDCDGVYAASILNFENAMYMYYIAWNRGIPDPLFRASIGLAVSWDNGLTFQKYSKAPILDRCDIDPFFVSGPTVIRIGEELIMYYISGTQWYEKKKGGVSIKLFVKESIF